MANLTNSYKNEDLINLAKSKYEKSRKTTIPSEIVTLTSEGKVYPKDHVLRSGKIEMRYMTAYDEDILTNASYIKEGIVIDKLLESLIVTDVDLDDISNIDKDGLIINARILSYGAEYQVEVIDPKTKNKLQRTVDLSKLPTKILDIASDDNGEFIYETETMSLKWKFPTKTSIDTDAPISTFLLHSITEVNGTRKKSDIEDFIRYGFLASESKKFQQYIIKHSPALLLEYEFEGEDGSTFTVGFPLGPDLFWF